MLEFDNENDEPLLSEKFDNIFNNFEEKNLIELTTSRLNLNRKDFINKNILEKDEFKILDNRKHNHSKSSDQKRKINDKKKEKEKRINVEFLDMKINKNDKMDDFDFEIQNIGFPNLGHTCYMNSFLQILIHTPNFIKELINLRKQNKINNELVNCLINLPKEQYNNLSKIKEIMGAIDKSYSELCQKDSQKFGIDLLNYLIQIIKEENDDESKNSLKKDNPNESASNFENLGARKKELFKNYKDEYFPEINEISLEKMFLFHESKIKIEINSNEIKNIKFEAYLNIEINLTNKTNQTNNLLDLLKNIYKNDKNEKKIINGIQSEIIIQKEKIENKPIQPENDTQNHITFGQKICNCFSYIFNYFSNCFCPKSNDDDDTIEANSDTITKEIKYMTQRKIANLSKILILTINRAILGEPFNMSNIHFEKILDVKQFLDDDLMNIETQNTEYILYAINECQSNNGESGHYYSYINISNDKWFKFNDEYVSRVKPSFNSENVSGLFYVKKDYLEEDFFNK